MNLKEEAPSTKKDSNKSELKSPDSTNPIIRFLKYLLRAREAGIAIIIGILFIFLSLSTDHFLSVGNIAILARQISLVAILAIGMTMVILLGGIDLSIGSVVVMTAVVLGMSMVEFQLPVWLAIGLGLLIGGLIGFLNGFLIRRTHVPSFIITLGMMGLARGTALVITKGNAISGFPRQYLEIGQGYLGPVPYPVIITLVLIVITHTVLTRTTFGRRVYLVGSNIEAARLSGINVDLIFVIVFTLCGLFASIESVIETARFSTAMGNAGIGYELTAIGAVIIGGASLSGGEGTIIGSVLGAVLLGLISNALIHLGISTYWQQVFSGTIIILAVALDTWRKHK